MTRQEESQILESAMLEFGYDSRIDLLIEECSELIAECCKVKRGRKNNLPEEIADVLIVIDQIMLLMPEGMVNREKEAKLVRLRGTVEANVNKRLNAK